MLILLVFVWFLLYNIYMRIIAGKFKGKKLNEFEIDSTRPTTDLVREAMFDKIGYDIVDSVFLDLFAGTGACGIEALSRGAKICYFVDSAQDAIKLINKNLKSINAQNCEIIKSDYVSALESFAKNSAVFDFVFLDPPYKSSFAEDAISKIFDKDMLAPNGIIVWEHDKTKLDYVKQNFPDSKTKKYGQKYLTYIQNNE